MMEEWKEIELQELCLKVQSGGTPSTKKEEYYGGNISWVKTKEIKFNRIYNSEFKITELGLKNSSAKLIPKRSILIAMYGNGNTAGRCAMNMIPLATNQACSNFTFDEKLVIPEFMFYKISMHYRDFVHLKSGGAQNNLNGKTLKQFKVSLPPLPTQRKIASILSAYDDLIENNLKRIQLLEEKARLTYEEWFVRMKFPGHEVVKWDEVSGLPVGWEKKTFLELVNVNPKTTIKKGTIAPYVPMKSLSTSSMVIQPIEEKAVSGGTKFKNGDTLFARITPCLENGKTGFVQFMKNKDQIATGSTEYIILRETEYCGKHFIYCTSRTEEFRQNAIKSMVGSDGRQRVKTDCFEKYLVNYATSDIRIAFEELSDQIFKSIQIMVNQNQLLKEARDLLLPRLMTGMIDVEALELGELQKKSI